MYPTIWYNSDYSMNCYLMNYKASGIVEIKGIIKMVTYFSWLLLIINVECSRLTTGRKFQFDNFKWLFSKILNYVVKLHDKLCWITSTYFKPHSSLGSTRTSQAYQFKWDLYITVIHCMCYRMYNFRSQILFERSQSFWNSISSSWHKRLLWSLIPVLMTCMKLCTTRYK